MWYHSSERTGHPQRLSGEQEKLGLQKRGKEVGNNSGAGLKRRHQEELGLTETTVQTRKLKKLRQLLKILSKGKRNNIRKWVCETEGEAERA